VRRGDILLMLIAHSRPSFTPC